MTTTAETHSFCSHPSVYLEKVRQGDTVILTDHGAQIAEIKPMVAPEQIKKPRPFGRLKGQFIVPDAFFDPLPAEILEAFEGGRTDPLFLHSDKQENQESS